MITGAATVAIIIYPVFWLVDSGHTFGVFAAMLLALPFAHAMAYAVVASFIPELFAPEVRFTGSSLAYQIGGIITSAPAPLIAATLMQETGNSMFIAAYVSIAALIGLTAIALGKQHREPPVITEPSSTIRRSVASQ